MIELKYLPIESFRGVRKAQLSAFDKAAILATMCRINTLYMIKRAGSGHIGSSFSAMDIVVWLYLREGITAAPFDMPGNVYYSSKGHDAPGLYSVLIGFEQMEFDLLHRLRRLDGLPGHPDVGTSQIATNTGSLGMGISKAKGMLQAARLRDSGPDCVYVMTGDGELQEGQLWESLQGAVNNRLNRIIAIVDHNKLQSDTYVHKVSDLGDLERKFAGFGWHVARCNGNAIAGFAETLEQVKNVTDKPKVIIADTVKGSGVSFMEHERFEPGEELLYPYHSGAPSDVDYERALAELYQRLQRQCAAAGLECGPLVAVAMERPPPPARTESLIGAYADALVACAGRQPNLVALDADLVLDCGLVPFRDKYPGRFFECGIAEQDMVSQAGGMALNGLLPFVHSFACFLSTRPNEQIYNNASEGTKIVYVGSLAGVIPSAPGHSHQSVRDISLMSAIPGMEVIQPACAAEVRMAVEYCLDTECSVYLRLVSVPCEIPYSLPDDYRLEPGKGVSIRAGEDAVLFAYGPVMLSEAFRAAQILQRETGLSVNIINMPWLNRIDATWLDDTVRDFANMVIVEDHYTTGGLGAALLDCLAQTGGAGIRVKHLGLTQIPLCGERNEVLAAHGLDARSLANSISRFCSGKD